MAVVVRTLKKMSSFRIASVRSERKVLPGRMETTMVRHTLPSVISKQSQQIFAKLLIKSAKVNEKILFRFHIVRRRNFAVWAKTARKRPTFHNHLMCTWAFRKSRFNKSKKRSSGTAACLLTKIESPAGPQPADIFGRGQNDCNLLLHYFRRGQSGCNMLYLTTENNFENFGVAISLLRAWSAGIDDIKWKASQFHKYTKQFISSTPVWRQSVILRKDGS